MQMVLFGEMSPRPFHGRLPRHLLSPFLPKINSFQDVHSSERACCPAFYTVPTAFWYRFCRGLHDAANGRHMICTRCIARTHTRTPCYTPLELPCVGSGLRNHMSKFAMSRLKLVLLKWKSVQAVEVCRPAVCIPRVIGWHAP